MFGSVSGLTKYLRDIEEEKLMQFLLDCSYTGFAKIRKKILVIIQSVVQKSINVTLTNGWLDSFRKRHPSLSLKYLKQLSYITAMCTSLDVYFDILEETLDQNDLSSKPCQIYNCDETGMPLDPAPTKVIAQKGQEHTQSITTGNKTQITVLSCCSASGHVLLHMIVFD